MLKWVIVALGVFLFNSNGFCQNSGKSGNKVNATKGKVKILSDVYRGNIPANGYVDTTVLVLNHEPFYDMGAFTFTQKSKNVTLERKGEWTVLKGSAKVENATVVELDIPDKTTYFLRLKNGNLQQLDTALQEIKPAGKYILVKQGK